MSSFGILTRVLTLFTLFAILLTHQVEAIAIPTPNGIASTEQGFMDATTSTLYQELPQTWKEVTLPGGILKIYDAPLTVNPAEKVKKSLLVKREDWCDNTTLVSKTTRGSPKYEDCVAIKEHARRNSYTFEVPRRSGWNLFWTRLYTFNSCVFGGVGRVSPAVMGNENVADLIEIAKTTRITFDDGIARMGAEGDTACATSRLNRNKTPVNWAVWHS